MAIDLADFLKKNKILIIFFSIGVLIVIGGILGYRYYNGYKENKAYALLGKGVRLYLSVGTSKTGNLKNIKKSIIILKQLKLKYNGTKAEIISNFYLGSDYLLLRNYKKSIEYFKNYTDRYPIPHKNNISYLAYSNIVTAELNQKNNLEAINYLKKMDKINDVKLQEYAMLEEASIYTMIGKPKNAVAIYKKMMENDAMTKSRSYIENLIQLNSKNITHK
ncbi:MAG: YfgM family protein [bacterium]